MLLYRFVFLNIASISFSQNRFGRKEISREKRFDREEVAKKAKILFFKSVRFLVPITEFIALAADRGRGENSSYFRK